MYVNPYINPYAQSLLSQSQQTTPQMPLQRQEVVNVSGRPGAEAYQMAANSSALLLDSTASIVWVAQTDGAGYKTLTPYDITPHIEVKQEDVLKKLEDRISKLEERVNNNGTKSNTSDASKQRKSNE